MDLAALVERNGFWKAYSTALEKQPGFDPRQLFYALSYFGDVGRDRFPIPDAAYARLTDTVDGWRRELARRVQGAGTDMRLAAVGGPPTDPAVPPRLDFRSTVDDTSRSVTNPLSVSVRPHQATGSGWELAICGAASAPLWVSDPYPTNEAAEDARGFALRVANSNYPLCIEGWDPEMPLGASYDPPSPEHAAALRVIPSPHPSGGWRLQATRPDRTVVITSSPYRDTTTARAAAAFIGVLHVFAGDTSRTGQVRATPHPGGSRDHS